MTVDDHDSVAVRAVARSFLGLLVIRAGRCLSSVDLPAGELVSLGRTQSGKALRYGFQNPRFGLKVPSSFGVVMIPVRPVPGVTRRG